MGKCYLTQAYFFFNRDRHKIIKIRYSLTLPSCNFYSYFIFVGNENK